jgi:NADPH:quinone reductase-like Zn-dependent oxidoreductase
LSSRAPGSAPDRQRHETAAGLTGQMVSAGTSRDSLTRLIANVEDGTVTIDVERTLPLDDADKGLETMTNRRARGKIVITIND